jgi:pimeloyl-ACP methyl ester carboxylesterase
MAQAALVIPGFAGAAEHAVEGPAKTSWTMVAPPFRSLGDAECFTVAAADGATLPVYALGGKADGPGLLFGHANGFAAGSYGSWLRGFRANARVFAFDARGHGGSRWPEGPLDRVFAVDRFADDLADVAAAVAARLGGAPFHYAAHSLNAAAALRLAARGGALPWSAMTLFEPPIFPLPEHPRYAGAVAQQTALASRSGVRRADWPSPEALVEVLVKRSAFAGIPAERLAEHCRATLRPLPEGGYRLACPPEVEAAIFRDHRAADTWARLGQVAVPVHLVGGDPDHGEPGWITAVIADMAETLPSARLTRLEGTGHMMIFERPAACRDLILGALRLVD